MTEDQNSEKEVEKELEAPTREEIEQVILEEEPTEPTEPVTPIKVKKPRAKAKPTITKEEI
eukprot:629909-Heterocapsa_arctica.AAC.1